jgi:hypothetical protein
MKRIKNYLALLSVYFFTPVIIAIITNISSNSEKTTIAAILFLISLFLINFLIANTFWKILVVKIFFSIFVTSLAFFSTYMFSKLSLFPKEIDPYGKLTTFFINGGFSIFIWEIIYQINKKYPLDNNNYSKIN